MPRAKTRSSGTDLGEVLSSPASVEKLKSSGFKTTEDLKKGDTEEFLNMGLGEVTMEEITNAMGGQIAPKVANVTVVESDADIHIQSPFGGYSLQIVPGGVEKNENGKGYRTVQPIYLVCESGRGRFTRRMWLLRKYGRSDMRRVEQAERDGEPWRVEAVQWLQKRKAHGTDFRIMSD